MEISFRSSYDCNGVVIASQLFQRHGTGDSVAGNESLMWQSLDRAFEEVVRGPGQLVRLSAGFLTDFPVRATGVFPLFCEI